MISLLQLQKELNTRSYYEFFKYFWDSIETVPFCDNWHIKYICDELQKVAERNIKGLPKQYDLIINIPPGSSKSLIVTIMFNAWVWTLAPEKRFITSSYSNSLSVEHSLKTRDLIMSDKFKAMYDIKLRKDKNNKSGYKNTRGGERTATSTGGMITGIHADFLIADDLINPKNATSEVERLNANEFLSKTLSTRKTNKDNTVTILVMQRLHEDDPTGFLLSNKEKQIKHICLPAEITDNISPQECKDYYINNLLDINRMPAQVLKNMLIDLGSQGYAGQILQSPYNADGNIFKLEWLQYYNDISYNDCYIFADTAQKTGQNNDYSAIGVFTVKEHKLYMIEMFRKKLEFPELVKLFVAYNQKYKPRKLYIEDKSSGSSLIQDLKRSHGLPIFALQRNKDKISRANAVSPKIEAGFCYIQKGLSDFELEYIQFPNSKHDDMIDVFISAIEELLMGKNNNIIQHRQVLF
jgi:predicted phage terminase large subunit-like protein